MVEKLDSFGDREHKTYILHKVKGATSRPSDLLESLPDHLPLATTAARNTQDLKKSIKIPAMKSCK
jgi:hypothetical protein